MPYRKDPLANDYYYHIYNRGNNRNDIFFEEKNYDFLLKRIKQNFEEIIEINTYCLMPNHFHLIVKMLDDDNFPKAMNKTFISYTKAINSAYGRSGHLFEDRYQYKLVPENNYLLHLSRYIHLNPVRAKLVTKPEDWKFSSYRAFIKPNLDQFVKHEIITDQIEDYSDFVNSYQEDQNLYVRDLLI